MDDLLKKSLPEFGIAQWHEIRLEIEYCRKQEMECANWLMEIRKRQNKAYKRMEKLWDSYKNWVGDIEARETGEK